jgi:hypothetical protein
VYVWSLAATPDLGHPVAHQFAPPRIQFSEDGNYLYSADATRVYLGRTGQTLDLIAASKSVGVQAITVTPDSTRLAIFTTDHVILAKRRFYLWGIPLWQLPWPTMAKPLAIQR